MTAQAIIGSCIRLFREKAGLTQDGLAQKAGISYQYLSGLENGQENFSIQVLERIASALQIPLRVLVGAAYDNADGAKPPLVAPQYFRPEVPLPDGLTYSDLARTLNHTLAVIHRINRNLFVESGVTLQSLIQGNNFSGLVCNLLSDSFDKCSPYRHNHHQRYPDLVNAQAHHGQGEGLEIKATVNIGKGGESHNGHSGWHLVACYNFIEGGNIQFVHLMFAQLNDHQHAEPDWKYVGSTVNAETGSRRTETFNTTPQGNAKLRDGSAYLDTSVVNFSRWRHDKTRKIPSYSIWATR
ncbi:MAG: helix-turn-helix transcriptional regulator [Acidovorax sp.]|uniref:helix-turn-helix domain-containing protein n=1 Tax=Acidovorax sp. TaxID=1872122 RepID=UPI0039E3AD4F